jgi:general secretion pathway protein F
MVHMIASGESTGRLPEMLERTATNLSQETERRALTLTGLLEPLLILIMGGVVLLIVLAVLLPIIEINQLVR